MCPPITLCCFFSSEFKLARKFFFAFFSNAFFSLVNKDMTDISPLILEGYSIAFQNGMTLENPMKIERFMARRLRSCVF